MKNDKRYFLEDVLNIVFFLGIFITLFVASILGIISFCKGDLSLIEMLRRIFATIAILIPLLIKKMFKVKISRILTSMFYLIIFLASFLGRTMKFYSLLSCYDSIMHFICGVYVGIFAIALYQLLNKNTKTLNKLMLFPFMIMFTMFVGAIWELFRYCSNIIINSAPLDGYGLLDTMIDLSCDLAGGVVAVIIIAIISKYITNFYKSLQIKKLKPTEIEVEDIIE